ncbi:hypothetical protein HRR83_009026 [Exophiala dermatitidis]|uniref:Uncharacterized protein n=1 Tax=Exophiala dermatitidis TaxID=5970 RepID=A0AAN6ENB4_EXODE|nr:hypothetical protein HRR73_009062 [Exophiala dermatitidis]KAJ4504039.1 hypothetical protein HRR74_009060 [Exophiala dermatitidis]KAJ4528974.1 hypothetical protein HRR76_009587 [Exophiala dermatitidis]KAJ4533200.1 hypothetical protein HRR77_008911 [Exophiala dermatitidis]KAJ4555902.1 hypothetical protein HRR79_008998 [Exophiala dermatitidis]
MHTAPLNLSYSMLWPALNLLHCHVHMSVHSTGKFRNAIHILSSVLFLFCGRLRYGRQPNFDMQGAYRSADSKAIRRGRAASLKPSGIGRVKKEVLYLFLYH